MRKQELIHYHGLLAEIAGYCQADGLTVNLETYHALETRPTSVQLAKSDHKDAVFALTEALTSSLSDEQVEPVVATAD